MTIKLQVVVTTAKGKEIRFDTQHDKDTKNMKRFQIAENKEGVAGTIYVPKAPTSPTKGK